MWGNSNFGALGYGITAASGVRTPVTTFAGGTNWKQVSYSTAIKTDGTLWVWGAGFNGRLGNFSGTNRSTPVTTFAGGTNWKQISGGGGLNMAAIKTDGTLWVWGATSQGTLGNAIDAGLNISTPITTFAGGTNWKQVECVSSTVLAVQAGTSADLPFS